MTLFYCKETGEEATEVNMTKVGTIIKCLIHGYQSQTHFEEEHENLKVCEVCGGTFYCEDDIRKVCSMKCAVEYVVSKT